jgi:hypothetical protein
MLDDPLREENLSALNKRQAFLFLSIPNRQTGSTGEVGVDKKMQKRPNIVWLRCRGRAK